MQNTASSNPDDAWRSKIYPRFHLTTADIAKIEERYLFENSPLTKSDLNNELHKAECWLRDRPAKAQRYRSWYKFINNWLGLAEERRATGKGHATRAVPTLNDADRTRAFAGKTSLG